MPEVSEAGATEKGEMQCEHGGFYEKGTRVPKWGPGE